MTLNGAIAELVMLHEHSMMPAIFKSSIQKIIETVSECELPSAQPEIIHCKDCKHWQDQEEGVVEVPICARPANKYEKFPFVMIIGGDGFCSYAERRTDERQT